MKRLGVNMYETDEGAVISRRERDYLTYGRGGRAVRLPVEPTVRIVDGQPNFGLSIGTNGTLHWSDGAPVSGDDVARVRTEIERALDELGTRCSFTG